MQKGRAEPYKVSQCVCPFKVEQPGWTVREERKSIGPGQRGTGWELLLSRGTSDLSIFTECFKTEQSATRGKYGLHVTRKHGQGKDQIYSRCITKISQVRIKQTFDNSEENEHCTLAYQRFRIRRIRRIFINLDSHISRRVGNRWCRTWCCSRSSSCYSFCEGVNNKNKSYRVCF